MKPFISVYGTVYNNVRTLRLSIFSILKALQGFPYEIVIVDNYSTDGSYEELLKLMKRGLPLLIFRKHCSRGTGRHIAAKLARGELLVYIDFDCVYTPILRLMIEEVVKIHKAIGLAIIPRDVYTKLRGFKDFNRAEDIDLWARMHSRGLCSYVPPLKVWIRSEYELPRYPSFLRELRYMKGLKHLKRFFINRMSQVTGGALSFKKIVRESIILQRAGIINLIIKLISFLPFLMLKELSSWKKYAFEAHRDLSNYTYVDVMNLCNMIIPQFLIEKPDLIDVKKLKDLMALIRYVSRFDIRLAINAYIRLRHVVKEMVKIVKNT